MPWGEIAVGALALIGVIITQRVQHRRWVSEQMSAQEERQQELLTKAGKERRAEQDQLANRISDQTNQVLEGALQIAEVHRLDANLAREQAAKVEAAHHECRAEVAEVRGKVEELRARMTENERTSGLAQLMMERHQDIKHRALNCLSVSEGYTALVQKRVQMCTCGAFDPLEDLTSGMSSHFQELIAENATPIEEWVRQHQRLSTGGIP